MKKSRNAFLARWYFSKNLNTVRQGAMETLELGEDHLK